MKTQHFVFSLVLLLALFLAACSPQAAPTEVMSEENEMVSETMEEKDDAMMAEKEDEISDHDSDDMDSAMKDEEADGDMMGDKDKEMMEEKDDNLMSDAEGDMDDHQNNAMDDKEDDSMMTDDDGDMAADDDMMTPDWFQATLTDARTGETFMIADFKGKVVLVETLAMWCSNCLKQQGQVQALHELVGERDDFVSLGVDIDPNENAAALSSYIDQNGFDWLYTVAPTEVSREIGQLYGDQYLNPPSTPMLIIDREGDVHLLPFGIKSATDLLDALQPFLDTEM